MNTPARDPREVICVDCGIGSVGGAKQKKGTGPWRCADVQGCHGRLIPIVARLQADRTALIEQRVKLIEDYPRDTWRAQGVPGRAFATPEEALAAYHAARSDSEAAGGSNG